MANLSKYDFTYIALKLLAIYFIVETLSNIALLFGAVVFDPLAKPLLKVLALSTPILMIIISILLWMFAGKFAKYISQNSLSENITQETKDLQSILLAVAGVIIFAVIFPQFITSLYAYFMFQNGGPQTISLVTMGLTLVLGLLLIFKAKNISSLLN